MNIMHPKTESHAVESRGKPSVFDLLDMTEEELYAHLSLEEREERERVTERFLSTVEASPGGPQLSVALEALRRDGTLKKLFGRRIEKLWDPEAGREDPDLHPEGNTWLHTLMVCSFLPSNASLRLKLGALFHDVDKPQTMRTFADSDGRIRVSQVGHEGSGARTFRDVLGERLRLYSRGKISADDVKDITSIVEQHGDMHHIANRGRIPEWAFEGILKQHNIGDLILIQYADSMGCGLSLDRRLSFLQAEYLAAEMRTRGVQPPEAVLTWIRGQVGHLKSGADKRGLERWQE